MGKIAVDFSKPGCLVARAVVADGQGWRQVFWTVDTDPEAEVPAHELVTGVVPGLAEAKARVQNGANEPQRGM